MAKKSQQELGGLPPELQTGPIETRVPAEDEKTSITLDKEAESNSDDVESVLSEDIMGSDDNDPFEFVVVKGHTVRHNGTDYPENAIIYLDGEGEHKDAERLLRLGVIVRFDDLKSKLLSNNPVTIQ
ncbi:hypothetical protein M5U04_17775 [Xenorhabdus sp. XENO-1]|uniref:hypothetical protein n=1 Tax=Xenorhabdus bovienii TaxID=40576 RepID=UPI0020CA56A2|nr:hypothetical protein [Xenorhabdus bovienii]MCP9269878.1 hypothetical protein [Xenorhabdus bovienii subsp. africana]